MGSEMCIRDRTSLVGPTTGVGEMVRQLASRMASYSSDELTGLLVSWQGRDRFAEVIPPGWRKRALPLPARLTHLAWRQMERPKLRGFDLVHGPNYIVPPADRQTVRLVTVHDLTAWRFPDLVDHHSRYYPAHLASAVAEGAHVHAVSDYVAAELEAELGIHPDRIHTIRNGFEPTPPGDGGRGRSRVGSPYVLSIGTVEPRKDYVSLVEAMASIWPIHPDLKLVIAGASGWGSAELDEAIDRHGARGNVQRLGYVAPSFKADLLAGAELLAFPSIYEGFGLPVLEAMHAGVPVVATNAGSIPEVAGRAAALVEPRDPQALAGALLSVLEDDTLSEQLILAGHTQVTNYSWDLAAKKLVSTYAELTA